MSLHWYILEAIKQALGTWPITMPFFRTETALGWLASSSSISTGSFFFPTTGVLSLFFYHRGPILVFLPQGSMHTCFFLLFFSTTGVLTCFSTTGVLTCFSTTGVHTSFSTTEVLTCFSTTGVHTSFSITGVHTSFSITGVHTCFPFWYDGLTCYLLSSLCCQTLCTVY